MMDRTLVTALVVAAWGVAGVGCGVQEHTKGTSPVTSSGSGGANASGSGGASVRGSGGASSASGGANAATTGGATATGGGPSTTGGSPGTAGGATGTGGRVATAGGSLGTSSGGAVGAAGAPGTGVVSGITINIGGTLVPKEKAIAFIHFGHSNMRGQASVPASLRTYFYDTQPGLWVYRGAGSFQLAKEPTAPENTTITTAGPGMALLRSAALAAPAGTQFISIGRGQGSAPSTDFLKGGLYYSTFMDRAMELKGKVTFGGIFVMLGITERHLPVAQQPGFPSRMQMIIASIRADLGEPTLPVYFCDYEQNAMGTLAPTGSVGVVVMPMVRMLPGLIPNLELVPTDGLEMQDDHHFDFAGHKLWAERAIGIMVKNKDKGWVRWGM